MSGVLNQADRLLAAVLAGRAPGPGSFREDETTVEALWQRVRYHGIAYALCERPAALEKLPPSLHNNIREEARIQSLWEGSHHDLMARLVEALEAAGCKSLVMKGTALAYSVYDEPAIRRRGDTDLLVRQEQLEDVRKTLVQCGFVRTDDVHIFQECWRCDTGIGFAHILDLHWQATNAPALRRVIDVDECFSHAQPLPRLCPNARAVDPVRLFMLGCLNQKLHRLHGYFVEDRKIVGGDRLIWALDNQLLAGGFSDRQWEELVSIACERAMAPICLDGIRLAQEAFDTPVPRSVISRLEAEAADNWVTEYLQEAGGMARLRADWAGSPGWRSKSDLLLARAFPPREQLVSKFPAQRGWPLPLLHILRLAVFPGKLMGKGRG